MGSTRRWFPARLALIDWLTVPTTALAQNSWQVTVTPTLNPLAIGFCGAVRLTVLMIGDRPLGLVAGRLPSDGLLLTRRGIEGR